MATKNPQAREAEVVNQLGDVTESKDISAITAVGYILPLKDLPKGYESLAAQYPTAQGFTLEGSSVALHF